MHQDFFALEQVERKRLLGANRRHSNDERPPAFNWQQRTGGVLSAHLPGARQVCRHTPANLISDDVPSNEERGGRSLNRRADRQKCIGDDLERGEGARALRGRPAHDCPPELDLREPQRLRSAAQGEREDVEVHDALGRRIADIQWVVGKYFVGYDGPAARSTDGGQTLRFFSGDVRPGGVVRRNEQQRPHVRGRRHHGIEVDLPSPVVAEAIRRRIDGLQPRQMLEERVTWLRDEHAFAGIAEQLEQPAVRFARTR